VLQVYSENNFTFVTVRDAGHMVPRYKPTQALFMLKHFLANELLTPE
jgi:carboxypeptidase C (cathepsin A)